MDSDQFLADAESFSRAVNAEHYLAGAGLKEYLEISPIYERYVTLFEGERFSDIARWGFEPLEQRYLKEFVASGYLENQTRTMREQYAAMESVATVNWDERPVAYRNVPILIANEKDAVRRHDLELRSLEVLQSFNPVLEERERRYQRGGRAFGSGDYVDLFDSLLDIDLAWLTQQLDGFISRTDDLYFAALDTYLREMSILRDDARKCDLARIFRAPQFDAMFPADRLLATLHSSLRDLGIELEEQTNIRLDVAPRPLKSPRAFCCAVGVPDDVRLVLKPSGGAQDYEVLLHEAGHAEHYGNIDRSLCFAYRWLGDPSITESYAFLFEYLMHDPRWLERNLAIERPDSFFHLAGFHKLYFLRRYGTKLRYEQLLHRADEPGDLAAVYDQMLSGALGVTYGPEGYLADVDPGLYAAEYLRAWIFESQLRQYLKREFDEDWFRNPRAGRFLIELWRDGQRNPVKGLAGFMGFEGLDLGPLTEEVLGLVSAR